MIHLYTGDGKGKTTVAIGLAIRAAGSGLKVVFAQFMKGNDSGELQILRQLPQIRVCKSDNNYGFFFQMSKEQKEKITEEHNRILDEILQMIEHNECDMVILDEVTYLINFNLVDCAKLEKILKGMSEQNLEIVMTGRDPDGMLMGIADYITEMKAIRHPYEKGIMARKGIEY